MSGRIAVSKASERTVDGHTFASKAEMKRYLELKIMERAGMICELSLQPRFTLQEAFKHPVHGLQRAIYYVADFKYKDSRTRQWLYEDAKGHRTEVYRLKKKLLLAKYPEIDFREVKA